MPDPILSLEELLTDSRLRLRALERRLALISSGLPDRISGEGSEVTNWDYATANGFYYGTNAANNPLGDGQPYVGQVTVDGATNRLMQEVYVAGATVDEQDRTFRRVRQSNGMWTAWMEVGTDAALLGTTDLNTVTRGGSYIQTSTANVTYARHYPPMPFARTGLLEVVARYTTGAVGEYVKQIYTDSTDSSNTWTRTWDGSDWTMWVQAHPSMKGPKGASFYDANIYPNNSVGNPLNNWRTYSFSIDTNLWNDRIGAYRLFNGLIVLTGMLVATATPATDTVIFTLPPSMRPEYDQIIAVNNGDVARAITVKANGQVLVRAGFTTSYISLDGVAFWAKDSIATGNWTEVATSGTTQPYLSTAWTTVSPATYGTVAYFVDPYGWRWWRGVVAPVGAAVSTDNVIIVNMASVSQPHYKEQHVRTAMNEGMAAVATLGGNLCFKVVTTLSVGQWLTLGGVANRTSPMGITQATQFRALLNSWVQHGAAYPEVVYTRRPDGLLIGSGLMSAGTAGSTFARITTRADLFRPAHRIILPTIANMAVARIDVFGEQETSTMPVAGTDGPGALKANLGSNTWFSFDSVKWVAGDWVA